jgi:WD40 repeat protein
VAFSPDGTILASSNENKRINLWDIESRRAFPWRLFGLTGVVRSLAFNPDGSILASGGNDGILILWDTDPGSWRVKTCNIVGRNLSHEEWASYFPDKPYQKTCPQWAEGE